MRARATTFLDGTHIGRTFSCCGLSSITNRDGSVISYDYDSLERLFATYRFVDAENAVAELNTLDPEGKLIATERVPTNGSPAAVLSLVRYNAAGRLVVSTNALNHPTFFTNYVNGVGETVSRTLHSDGGTRIETKYRDGSLKSITGTAVQPVRYEYGVEGESGKYRRYTKEIKLAINGDDTLEWTKTYSDMVERIYKTVYSDDATELSSYNIRGQLTNHLDPDGVITLYAYNGRGERFLSVVDSNRNYTIDFVGNDRISLITNDVLSAYGTQVYRTRAYVWDTSSDSSKLISTSESSVDGLRTWSAIWNGGVAVISSNSIFFDPLNATQVTTNTAADGSYSVATNLYGRLASVTRYDSTHGKLEHVAYGYDPHSRQNAITDGRNNTTTFAYNNADLVVTTTTPSPGVGQAAQTMTNYFDVMGRVSGARLSDGTSMTNKYDVTGALTNTSGSRTYPVAYSYDAQGRMKTMKTWKDLANSSGTAITTWNYDLYRGWLTNKSYDGGSAGPTNTYTAAGRLATRTWARGVTTTFAYNDAGDLGAVDYSDTTPDLVYTYDRLGRKSSVMSGSSVCSFTLNDVGGLLAECYTGGPLDGLCVTNSYDALLRRTAVALSNVVSTLVQYGYDNASRLATVTNGLSTAAYGYLANSPLVEAVTFKQNGTTRLTTTKSFDNLNRLTEIASAPSGDATVSFKYQYNTADQRTAVTNADNSRWSYQYDALGQVTSGKKYWGDNWPVAGQQFEYAFDDIGNRKSTASGGDQFGANLRYTGYTNNSLNQLTGRSVPGYINALGEATNTSTVTIWSSSGASSLTSRKTNYFRGELLEDNNSAPLWLTITNLAVLNDGSNPDIATNVVGNVFLARTPETFGYDADGNMTNDGRWALVWDAENRLIGMTSLSGAPVGSKLKLEFAYDCYGRRIQKLVSTNDGSGYIAQHTNRFVYDGWNLVAELDPAHSALRNYTWGLDLSETGHGAGGVGGLLVASDSVNGTNFYAFDGKGNVVSLTKASDGKVSATYEYGPFGEPIRSTGPLSQVNSYRFSTKYQDVETDLLYYGYRFYNSVICRWVNRDPVMEEGGLNLYGFIGNDPLNGVDFLGLEKLALVYEFLKFGPFNKGGAHEPKGTIYVDSTQEILNDLHSKLKSDEKGNCANCIKSITFSAHGSGSGALTFGPDAVLDVKQLDNYKKYQEQIGQGNTNPRILANVKKYEKMLELLNFVAKHLCKGKSKVTCVVCDAGSGNEGQALLDQLESVFGEESKITLYPGDAGFWFGKPYGDNPISNHKGKTPPDIDNRLK